MGTGEFIILFLAAVFVSTYAIVIGGAMFLALPVFQAVFPGAALGQLIATIKLGSLARGATSVAVTWRQIRIGHHVLDVLVPLLLGVGAGTFLIAGVSQLWVLPAILLAIGVSENAKRLSSVFTKRLFQASAFVVGLYGGLIGAGVITMIVALLRIKEPADADIAQVRIDANAVEFVMNIGAVLVAWRTGVISGYAWVPWAAGSVVGGVLGGRVLKRMITVSRRTQRLLLLAVYAVAVAAALVPWVNQLR